MTMYTWNPMEAPPATSTSATATLAIDSRGRMRHDVTPEQVVAAMREAKWFIAALPCLVCVKPLSNVLDSPNQPNDGVSFATDGNYGSTVWDEWGGELIEINICDDCLMEASRQLRVLHFGVAPARERPARPVKYWDWEDD